MDTDQSFHDSVGNEASVSFYEEAEETDTFGAVNDRPTVTLRPQDIVQTTDRCIKLLAPLRIYQRGPSLVHVRRDAGADERERIKRDGAPQIVIAGKSRIAELLDTAAAFHQERTGKRGASYDVPCTAPDIIVSRIMDRREWDHVRPLRGISRWPLMRSNGTIADGPAYDQACGYIVSQRLGDVPTSPTKQDAEGAVTELLEAVQDFPFASDIGKSVWLAALLTPIARPAIAGPTPLFYIDANMSRSGKTLLAQLVGLILAGRRLPVASCPNEDAEWSKLLLAMAISGDPVVLFDNLKGKLGGAELEKVLTATEYSTRLLGKNENPTYPFSTVLLATSNNGTVTDDLVGRTLQIRLVSETERPGERTGFKHDPLEAWVTKERPRLLRAALTILRAYRVANRPAVTMRAIGGFEAWSDWVRAPLVWAGLPDPVESQDDVREMASPETDDAMELIIAWHAAFGSEPQTSADLVKAIRFPDQHEPDEPNVARLRDAVCSLCKSDKFIPSASKVGYALRALRDKIAGGVAFKAKTVHGNTKAWSTVPIR
jgi:hypothetical protein